MMMQRMFTPERMHFVPFTPEKYLFTLFSLQFRSGCGMLELQSENRKERYKMWDWLFGIFG